MTDSTYIRSYNGKSTRLDNLCLGADNNSYRLYVNGTSYFNGDLTIPNNYAYYGILGSNSSTISSNVGGLTWFNIYGTAGAQTDVNDTPTTDWWYILRNRHTNTSNNYYTDIAIPFNDTSIYYKIIRDGDVVNNAWIRVLDTNNYTGTLDNRYVKKSGDTMTGDLIAPNISAHTSNKSNPHGVTKSQVGLGSVANIDQSKAIKSITRSGTTFTATALDGTKTTFDQQDNNTTYNDATTSTHGLMSAADKSKLNGIASGATKNVSTVKNITLSASSWSSGAYTISDSLITASSNQEVLPATNITAAQYNALNKAQIIDGGQSAGKLTLKALGTVPTINIPIRIIFRGTI